MEFRVLGPVEVHAAGGALAIGGPMQRTLLAILVLHENRPVPVERLIDELWPDGPPATARNLVQGYVSDVRRALEPSGPGETPLLTRQAGYELRVEAGQLDLQRFEELVDEARRAREAGRLQAAVERLRAALAVWRGAALAGVNQGTLEGEALRLEEARLLALEDRVDLELELGGHNRLIGELTAIRAERPLRERPTAQLMLALYRAGRRADALAVYQEARKTLADQLGIDPGPELRRLERAILKADPALHPQVATAPLPRELPRPLGDFTGRDAELAALERALGGDPDGGRRRPVVISGMGGIGKSALAIRAAHRLVDAGFFPDGQLYVNLQGATAGTRPLAPVDALGQMLRSLGVDPTAIPNGAEEAAARFRSLVARRRLLLLLDNASGVEQVARLLPGSSTCGVLLTSRQVLATLEGAWTLHLEVLPEEQALDLLEGIAGPDRIAGQVRLAADLVARCGRLPLAIRIAGARLLARPQWTLDELAQQLADAGSRLEELQAGELAVRASFDVSVRALQESPDPVDAAAAAAFGLLGLPDGPDVGGEAAARLLDRPRAAAQALLERLVDAQLLETAQPGRYRFHDLVRLYARERSLCRPAADREAALERVLGFYTATAWGTLALLRPGDRRLATADRRWSSGGLEFEDASAALDWLETERADLVAAIAQAAGPAGGTTSDALARLACELTRALFGFFYARGYWHDIVQANETALEVARRIGDRAAQANAWNDLGLAYEWLGPYTRAIDCWQESLAIYRELGDRHGEAGSLNNLGVAHTRLGQDGEAIAGLERSLAVFRDLDDCRGMASSLSNLARAYGRVGRVEEAITRQTESVALFRELGASLGIASSLNNLGVLQEQLGRHEEAISCQRESLATYRRLGAGRGQVVALRDLGDALRASGREAEALAAWQEALTVGDSLQMPEAGEIRLRLGLDPG